jgi:hypothetical protein
MGTFSGHQVYARKAAEILRKFRVRVPGTVSFWGLAGAIQTPPDDGFGH